MKIGLVIYGSIDTVSGGYLYDRKMVAHLRAAGDDVRIISIPVGSYFSHLLKDRSFRLPVDLDIVIEDELVHPSVLSANRAYRGTSRVPVVSLVHNLHSSERRPAWENALYRRVEKAHLRSVDGFIFNSTITRDSVARLVGDPQPAVLAPPGGDRLGSLSAAVVQHRVAHAGPLRLLFLANVTPLKGLHVVLDALSGLPAETCTLDVAGSLAVDQPYARSMQAGADELVLPVTFHGVLDGQALVDLLAASDVLVLPSYYEGFGIAYLEGMAFGLPAIGTTAGAIPHMIRDGHNGFTIRPGDAAALREIIGRLAADRALLARMSANALEYYSSCPTWEQSGESIRRFLLGMVSSARA